MKKLLLLTIGASLSVGTYAQRAAVIHGESKNVITSDFSTNRDILSARTTAVGDTFIKTHFSALDTPTLYSVGTNADSGYVVGIDAYGDKAFAERYAVNPHDSTIKVIGVETLFGGKINPASTKTVTFNVWTVGARAPYGTATHIFYSGLPNTVLTSQIENVTNLGIGLADTALDTFKAFLFTTPTAYLRDSFFIGYNINYSFASLGGDTIGLYTNKQGHRTSLGYTVSGPDTIINDQNATMYSDNTWHDDAQENFQVFNNLAIFPIIKIGISNVSVQGITKNNFTFFGNYPNPATNSTNVKFSLNKGADVEIVISDLNGHTIRTVSLPGLASGDHIVPVETANLAAGEYIYLVHTSDGDGIASKMTVIK